MKKNLSLVIILVLNSICHSQFYERTNKNIGVYFSVEPLSSLKSKSDHFRLNAFSGSVGVIHKIVPGIYISGGYTDILVSDENPRYLTLANKNISVLDASLFLDKRIAKLMNQRINGRCHYLSLGFIGGPEYHYVLPLKSFSNDSFGEISGIAGLSLNHVVSSASKKSKSWSFQYDIYYRKGFTPLISFEQFENTTNLYRQEIGLRVRIIKHQVYDFLK